MQVTPLRLPKLVPPKDDLLRAIVDSTLVLTDGDVLAISAKVVSVWEGRCVPESIATKEALIAQESDMYMPANKWGYQFTVTHGALIGSAGIDQSNGNGYYILWPKDPMRSAMRLRVALMRHYNIHTLGVVITDSTSRPLRRGASGFALAWAGFHPLYDYRGQTDIFGRPIRVEQANIADSLAATAVLMMGEAGEQTPIALLRGVPAVVWEAKRVPKSEPPYVVSMKDDLFSVFLKNAKWKKGRKKI
jgi:dihydrofolate synthase / folylpolyglutamate synthase